MRFLMKVTIPVEAGNVTIKDGSLGRKIQSIMEDIKPEAAYFSEENGNRTAFIFVNIEEPSGLPAKAEPFWLGFNARVEFHPAMTAEDLAKAGPSIEAAAKKYG